MRTRWPTPFLVGLTICGFLGASALAHAAQPEALLEPWPKERVHHVEVGRHDVRWRERGSKPDGIFAGVRFTAPLERQAVWDEATKYEDIGHITPGVVAVRTLEQTPTHEVIELDVKVLWKRLTLTFQVDREPPHLIQFQLNTPVLGEYRGVCVFDDAPVVTGKGPSGPGTVVEMATWLKPSRPVPIRMLLLVERMTLLQGVRRFLNACDQRRRLAIAR